eukprot:TRINITY_DN300_c11_g1_i1.p1 TRINITY_DN300_c11_g1~~TRINITY_DN300_c11_g1_i1.p1  ORF type:complete len:913 (+),score=273.66 TRINITY_DN300_c11_g1_i1:70-2808(+)
MGGGFETKGGGKGGKGGGGKGMNKGKGYDFGGKGKGKGKGGGGGGGGGGGRDRGFVKIPTQAMQGADVQRPDTYIMSHAHNERPPMLVGGTPEERQERRRRVMERLSAVRPLAPGGPGTPADHICNLIPLTFEAGRVFYQYAVVVKHQRELSKREERKAVDMLFAEQKIQDIKKVMASSGIMFTSQKLPKEVLGDVPISDEKGGQYSVRLTYKREISTGQVTQEMVTVVASVVRDALAESDMQKIGRTYFDLARAQPIRGFDRSLAPGVYTAVQPMSGGGSGLGLLIDQVHKCIGDKTLWEEAQRGMRQKPDLGDKGLQTKLRARWVDCVMLSTYETKNKRKRTFHVDEVRFDENANTPQAQLDGKSLKEYFQAQYGVTGIDSNQPVLVSFTKRKDQDGKPIVEKYLPQLARSTGVKTSDPSTKELREQLIRVCALRPPDRYTQIKMSLISNFGPSSHWHKLSSEWGLSLKKCFPQVKARALPRPTMEMSGGFAKECGDSWNFDIDKRPQNPHPHPAFRTLKNIPANVSVLCPVDCKTTVDPFLRAFVRSIQHFAGRQVDVKPVKCEFRASDIEGQCSDRRPDPVLAFAPHTDDKAYGTLKRTTVLGRSQCVSQVVRVGTAADERKLKAVANKVATQVLVKMGNSPWTLKEHKYPGTMVVGISFHHAGSAEMRQGGTSVAGIAATVDPSLGTIAMEQCAADPGAPWAPNLAEAFSRCLARFKKANGGKSPANYIFFRQGSSEGVEQSIVDEELESVRQAIQKATDSSARIAYIMVLRQTHLRLARVFSTGEQGTEIGNPQCGTVLDSYATNLTATEFFMVSQFVNQGSATAVKYKMLCNELDATWTMARLQSLTCGLSCMYFNWNGPVALPAPCLYAAGWAKMCGEILFQGGSLRELEADSYLMKYNCIASL